MRHILNITVHLSDIITAHQPNLMFIHFDTIDDAGHKYGWGSKEYYDATKVKLRYPCIVIDHELYNIWWTRGVTRFNLTNPVISSYANLTLKIICVA